MSWLAAVYAVATRGGAMGATISAAFFGTVIGPVIGAVAASVGRQVTFTVVAAGLAVVALWGGPRYATHARPKSRERESLAPVRHSALLVPLGTFVALGVVSGTVLALGPLLLTGRGFGSSGIAACFVAAAAPQVLFTTALGRRLGRSGPVRFCVAMMLLYGVLIPLTALATGQLVTAVLFPLVVGVGWVVVNPLMLLTSAVADRVDVSQGLAMSLANGSWGGGAALGALALTRVAEATSMSAALIAAGVIALLTGAMLAVAVRTGAALTHDAPA
jgi:predicted MFS family arabinose efflux permease